MLGFSMRVFLCHHEEGDRVSEHFRGEVRHKLDSKKRVAIPAEFRRVINSGRLDDPHENQYSGNDSARLTIVYGDHRLHCLKCFTEQAIKQIDDAIALLDRSSKERKFLEYFFQTKSITIQLDPSGRLVLAENLRKKINLASIVCFAGKGESFEIWNPEDYEREQAILAQLYSDIGEEIDPLSLIDGIN